MVSFADVASPFVSFDETTPVGRLALRIIDTPWLQRLRDISQTANTRLVYMFSEHSRFGHTLGVAHLAQLVLNALRRAHPHDVGRFEMSIIAAALLHDVGHFAPGSHTAWHTWFPGQPDEHEVIGQRIITEAPCFQEILSPDLRSEIVQILDESPAIPAWAWQIISGGGWNADRGNWCLVDSVMAGVSYGRYNIEALVESFAIGKDGNLVIRENRLDALTHFAVSRHAMYEQLYQHRVIMSCDKLNAAIAGRARTLPAEAIFADATMRRVLEAKRASELSLTDLFVMREAWWRYHALQWSSATDPILADLCDRLLNRRLFKTIRTTEQQLPELLARARAWTEAAGFDPKYYLHSTSTKDFHRGDRDSSLRILQDNGEIVPLSEAHPLFNALVNTPHQPRAWVILPAEAKSHSGLSR